jgi:MoaA/NifB/PqqE/SkfB family radical SAM enzyme
VSVLTEARYAAGLALGRPFQVLVQVTNRCNMQCSFCDFWPNGARPEEELSLDEHRRLAAELAGLGTFLVSLEGGEPFVRPDLVELVRAYAGRHLPTLFTNGWWVTPEGARALFDAGLAQVGVSIDFPDAARHDGKRGPPGTFERALRAVEALRDAAPHGGKQVHIMTILMESNWRDLDALLRLSADRGVGHAVTLLSTGGYRRGQSQVDRLPPPEAARHLLRLWRRRRHVRFFREYFQVMETFLEGGATGSCRAGVQTFNVDHVGNVSPCIERIDQVAGNVRRESLAAIHARLVAGSAALAGCNACWTACRGFAHVMGGGGSARAWADLATRMRSR